MIKCVDGEFSASGTGIELLADFTVIVKCLDEHISKEVNSDISKQILENAFSLGFVSEEEISVRSSIAEMAIKNPASLLKIMSAIKKGGDKDAD